MRKHGQDDLSPFARVAMGFGAMTLGPGPRECDDGSTGLLCSGPFAFGAVILDVGLVWMAGLGVRRLFRRPRAGR